MNWFERLKSLRGERVRYRLAGCAEEQVGRLADVQCDHVVVTVGDVAGPTAYVQLRHIASIYRRA